MSDTPSAASNDLELDPVFLNSRREAIVIFLLWFVCLLWAVPVSYMLGYGQEIEPGNVPTILGMPKWTFWGIVCPWLVADVVTTWLCFRFIKEDDLGRAEDEEPATTAAAAGDATADGEDA